MNITYVTDQFAFDSHGIMELFESVGWKEDSDNDIAFTGLLKSSHLVLAFDDSKLVGLIRSMSDDIYCSTIDVLLVHKDYQGKHIGSELIKRMRDLLSHVKYIIVAPNEIENASLYQRCGFTLTDGCLLMYYN